VLPRLAYLTLCRSIQLLVLLARGDARQGAGNPRPAPPTRCATPPDAASQARARRPGAAGCDQPHPAPGPAGPASSMSASPRASTSAPATRSPPGWRPSATTSPMCELRCCPISTRTTSAGWRSSNAARGHGSRARPLRDPAPTGVPVAAGRTACATTGEREAPPRSRLARARRPRVAAARRPGPRHRPRARGPRRAPLAGGVSLAGAPRGCASQVVARSEQQATGHAPHGHRWLLSQHRAPLGGPPPRRRRPHRQQDRSAWRL
jgi:hypothetical protein